MDRTTILPTPMRRPAPAGGGRRGLARAVRLVPLACATAMAGCRPAGYPVAGTVSFDDAPVAVGMISFVPADGTGPTFGGVIADGRYEVVAPTPGAKVVRVAAVRPTGRKLPPDPISGETDPVDEIAPYIPEQYNDRSTLTCDVVAGPNTFDFHLKSP